MFEIIKEQWDEGCYAKASDLDVYVQAGWITKEQEEITAPKAPVAPPVVEQTTRTAPVSTTPVSNAPADSQEK